MPKHLLLVDDHKIFIEGLQTLLNRLNGYKVVGTALNGEEALNTLEKTNVDIVITDINMPIISGTELTKHIKKRWPDIKVLVLSMYNDREIIHEIILSEAEGYILKNSGKQELVRALEKVSEGGTYYCNEVIDIISENVILKKKIPEDTKKLTSRESEILGLVCQEFSTPEIANKLSISRLTVDTHRKKILQKTKTRTIVGLIKYAISNGLA